MQLSLRKVTNRPRILIRRFHRRPPPIRVNHYRPRASGRTPSPFSESLVRDAIKQIDRYCAKFPQDSQKWVRCLEAREYFAHEALDAEGRCEFDKKSGISNSTACDDFEDWEKFVRQVEVAGGVREMVRTLLVIKNAKERKSSIVPTHDVVHKSQIRELCESMFNRMDKNHDGRIDVEEFRTLMKLIGDELSGQMVSIIFEALDIHGSLDLDQLITIVEAESIRSHSQTADWLRSAQRHGHASDTPKWIQNV